LVISECVMDGPDVGKGASHQPLTCANLHLLVHSGINRPKREQTGRSGEWGTGHRQKQNRWKWRAGQAGNIPERGKETRRNLPISTDQKEDTGR
jgi:hypothetical protein